MKRRRGVANPDALLTACLKKQANRQAEAMKTFCKSMGRDFGQAPKPWMPSAGMANARFAWDNLAGAQVKARFRPLA